MNKCMIIFAAATAAVGSLFGAAAMPSYVGSTGGWTAPVPATGTPSDSAMGNPAIWLRLEEDMTGLTTVEQDGRIYATKWSDVRGDSYSYARTYIAGHLATAPEVVTNGVGKALYVHFPYEGAVSDRTIAKTLFFDRTVTGIRSVFKVSIPVENMSSLFGDQILGGSELWREGQMNPMYRIFWPNHVAEMDLLSDARMYLNGVLTPVTSGVPYAGFVPNGQTGATRDVDAYVPQLFELHMPAPGCQTDNIAAGDGPARNGCSWLKELICYTNELSGTERLRIAAYLMKRHLDADISYETVPGKDAMPQLDATGDARLDIAAGGFVNYSNIVGTAGAIRKGGEGTLLIDDAVNPSVGLDIQGGTVKLHSPAVPLRSEIPADALIHLDVSDTSTHDPSPDPSYLHGLYDVRGRSYPFLTAWFHPEDQTMYGQWPHVITTPAGKTMANLGGLKQTSGDFHNHFDGSVLPQVRSFFYVTDTETDAPYGGFIAGDSGFQYANYDEGGFRHGLLRSNWNPSSPLVSWAAHEKTLAAWSEYSGTFYHRSGVFAMINDAEANPFSAGFAATGTSVASLRVPEPVIVRGVGGQFDGSYRISGGAAVGEVIYYERMLSDNDVRKVHAYLNRKWRGVDTIGYRAASVGDVKIAAGATLAAEGAAPVTVKSLSGAGTVECAVNLAADAVIEVTVNGDGSLSVPVFNNDVTFAGAVTVRVVGALNKAVPGTYMIVPGDQSTASVSLVVDGVSHRVYTAAATGSGVTLTIVRGGTVLFFR